MQYALTAATLAVLTTLTSAHFELKYPKVRGFNEDTLTNFPCGGQDTVSSARTPWPLKGGFIELEMGHITSNVEVLIAVGNEPGSAFNTVLRPTFSETGLGAFCMPGFIVPAALNVTAGTNATIQVQTNGDPDGGLYNCADITFVADAPATSESCTNGSVTINAATVDGHANGTKYGSSAAASESASSGSATPTQSGSSSGTAAAPAATSSKGAAAALGAGFGGLVMAGVAALAIVL